MTRPKALIVLASLALILSVISAQKSGLLTECAQLGEKCSLHRHCCGENLKCDQSSTVGRYVCKEKVKLGDSCGQTVQCIDIWHSKCSEKKCVCRENQIKVSDFACAPLLYGYCWKNETCVTENSLCVDDECQCKEGFLAEFDKCLPAVLGLPCNDDAACNSVEFAICSSMKVCSCSFNMIATNKRRCGRPLGSTCQTDQNCSVINSWCSDEKCQCRPEYFALSNMECKLAEIGMPCNRSIDCLAHFSNSFCIKNTCICKPKYLLRNGNLCLTTGNSDCTTDKECLDPESFCISNRCQCSSNYVMRESKCLPKQLTGPCRTNSDCSEVDFAVCLNEKCTCANGFFNVNATTCAKSLNENCIIDGDCPVKYSMCFEGTCQCSQGYIQYSESQCMATDLGRTCLNDSTCKLIKNTHCFESECRCKDEHIELDTLTCAPLLNATCSNNLKCATKNSVCIDHKCQCEYSYYAQSKYECVLRYLEKWCRVDKDCSDVSYAKCSDAGKCICHKNYLRTGPTTCTPTLGGYCKIDRDCVTVNAICSKNQCRCSAGFMQRSDLCFPVFLGQTCDILEDCDKIANAECFHATCKCRPGYTKFDRRKCLPLIGENCTEHKECAVYNSNCVDNKCQCLETFVPQSQSKCLSTKVDVFCYTNNDCEILNTYCSRFQYCVCRQNYISIDEKSCILVLGARCVESASCTTPNSECIDQTCECSRGFVRGPYNDCLPVTLGSLCETNVDCKSIRNAICFDKVCVCNTKSFALTSLTCTNLLNTSCLSSDDCGVESSHCFENKCQCRPDWMAISDTMCEIRSALYDCDDRLDCGEPWHSNCYENYCVCNSNHIAVSSLTCLPILNGNCWRDDQCMTKNSYCIDFRCKCKPGFIFVAVNMCVAR